MKIYISILVFTIILFGCRNEQSDEHSSYYKEVITKYTEIKKIVSEEVDDTFYIYIRLPKFYNDERETYPVLYLLDGDIAFNMTTSIVRYLQYGQDIPNIITVGIGYGTMLNDNETNFRERDYSISKIERFNKSGGGKNFSNFLENELIPMIEKEYRTSDVRILNGYSLGGLAAINILLTKPDLFNKYIAGSPYLINDVDYLIKMAVKTISFSDSKRIFISVGETEDIDNYQNPIIKMNTALKSIENLELKFVRFEYGTHFTCPSEALTYGLKYVFDQMKQ